MNTGNANLFEAKPGDVVMVVPKEHWRGSPIIIADSVSDITEQISTGCYPNIKELEKGKIGFVVSFPPVEEKIFDWLIEISVPEVGLQGWVQKTDIKLVT